MDASFSFAVVSDVHGREEAFARAVRDLKRVRPGLAALVVNGDFVDTGLPEEYGRFARTLDELADFLPPKMILNIGNHEFYPPYGTGPNPEADEAVFLRRYLTFAGRERVYAEDRIGGTAFIHLGSESTYNRHFDDSTVRANLSPAQLAWFEERIAAEKGRGRPVFVFLHQQLDATYRASPYYEQGVREHDRVRTILEGCPEAILFTAHTHSTWRVAGMNEWRSSAGFVSIDTGSVARPTYVDFEAGEEFDFKPGSSEGVVVDVRPDGTVIRPRDFANGEWIAGAAVVVPAAAIRREA